MQMKTRWIITTCRHYSSDNLRRLDRRFAPSIAHVVQRKYTANSRLLEPVKLSYASYESMKNEQEKLTPILIMHGLFGSKNNWNSLSKAIHQATGRKVISIDARNHGDSPHTQEMSYPHMTEDIIELLRDQGVTEVILIGHSMGGGCVMYSALTYPEIVKKLIVVDFSPVKISPSLASIASIFQSMRSVHFDGVTTLTKARKSANEQMASTIQSDMLRQFLLMNLIESESGEFKWRVNLPVLETIFRAKIATFPDVNGKVYPGPTLFLGGGNSDYINPDDHESIKKLFPQARFHYIAGAGHWLHVDKPGEFISQVTNFINDKKSE